MLHDGLKNSSPPATDGSMKPPPGRVNDDAVRSGPAKTPKTPGPRTA